MVHPVLAHLNDLAKQVDVLYTLLESGSSVSEIADSLGWSSAEVSSSVKALAEPYVDLRRHYPPHGADFDEFLATAPGIVAKGDRRSYKTFKLPADAAVGDLFALPHPEYGNLEEFVDIVLAVKPKAKVDSTHMHLLVWLAQTNNLGRLLELDSSRAVLAGSLAASWSLLATSAALVRKPIQEIVDASEDELVDVLLKNYSACSWAAFGQLRPMYELAVTNPVPGSASMRSLASKHTTFKLYLKRARWPITGLSGYSIDQVQHLCSTVGV